MRITAGAGAFESGAQAYTSTGWPPDVYVLLVQSARAEPAPIKNVTAAARIQIRLIAFIGISIWVPDADFLKTRRFANEKMRAT
jgi:hypothetical protein